MPVTVVVTEVEPSKTFALRQEVLRPHQRLEQMALFDAGPGSASFAAIDEGTGEVVGTAAVHRAEMPEALEACLPRRSVTPAVWRLRGMATREDLRSQGIGAAVLARLLDHVSTMAGGLLWCYARSAAAGFYEREGFAVAGQEFEEDLLGPHLLMWRVVEPAGPADRHAAPVDSATRREQ